MTGSHTTTELSGRLLAAFAAVCLASCSVELVAPEPLAVSPSRAYNGGPTPIVITGNHFYPKVELDAVDAGRSDVDSQFEVRLVPEGTDAIGVALEGVTLQDYQTLLATVPAFVAVGAYDLVVFAPNGARGTGLSLLEVVDTRVDHISLSSASLIHTVDEEAQVTVAVLDPLDALVEGPIAVSLTALDASGKPADAVFTGGLTDLEVRGDASIVGLVGETGTATVGVVVSTPGQVTITAELVGQGPEVDGDELQLEWEPGEPTTLEIALPGPDFEVVAGVEFNAVLRLFDSSGNPVDDRRRLVVLRDTCASWAAAADVFGETVVPVTLTAATGTDECPSNRLESLLDPLMGSSEPVAVLAGAADHFVLALSSTTVTAGGDLSAFAAAADPFGNVAAWSGVVEDVQDNAGGVASWSCSPAPLFCTVQPVIAGTDLHLILTDDAGITGRSAAYAVVPAEAGGVVVGQVSAPVTAGEPFDVEVWRVDPFGNAVPVADASPSEFTFSDPDGEAECSFDRFTTAGWARFACVVQTVSDGAVLTVTDAGSGGTTNTLPFQVVNGALSRVEVVPDATTVVAGSALTVDLAGFDAFNNPWIVQTDPVVDLEVGGVAQGSAGLDAAGLASAEVAPELAGPAVVEVWQGGALLGTSSSFTVLPAAADQLIVTLPDGPWAWTDAATPVQVEAVDVFGNRADLDATVQVVSAAGAGPAVDMAMVAGLARDAFTWSTWLVSDSLDVAEPGGAAGSTTAIVVASMCATGGPTAHIALAGEPEGIACLQGNGTANLPVSLAASTSGGGASLNAFGLIIDGVFAEVRMASEFDVDFPGTGGWDVRGFVRQTGGCGAVIETRAWIGADDGTPTGPVVLTATPSVIDAGGGLSTLPADIEVSEVVDCTRDPAAGGELRLWSSLGVLGGAVATGSGLSVVLDAVGEAAVDLDASSVATGGTATITAWVPGGSAGGVLEIDVVGDSRSPQIWTQTPIGTTTVGFDLVTLEFSEPMLADNIVPANIVLAGPTAVDVADVELQADQRTALVLLDGVADPLQGDWSLTVTDDVRDAAGNRLDGAWSGVPGEYLSLVTQTAASAPDVLSCSLSGSVIAPDGDDGVGEEADQVVLSFEAEAVPHAWGLSVVDAGGEVYDREVRSTISAADSWTWDGRGADEALVPTGTWNLTVVGKDALGNEGGACVQQVTIRRGESQ